MSWIKSADFTEIEIIVSWFVGFPLQWRKTILGHFTLLLYRYLAPPGPSFSVIIFYDLPCNFFVRHTLLGYVKFQTSILCGLLKATTHQKLPQRTIDPLTPKATPRGYPHLRTVVKKYSCANSDFA